MKKNMRLICLIGALLCLFSSCIQSTSTLQSSFPSRESFELCPPDHPNTEELNNMIFQASGNDYRDSKLSLCICSENFLSAVLYQAKPVFPNEQAQQKWKQLSEACFGALASENQELKSDFTLERVQSYIRINSLIETVGENGWEQSAGFFCYWNPQTEAFLDFVSLFDGFADYRQFFCDYLTQQSTTDELKELVEPERFAAFVQGELSFSEFEILADGVKVTLNQSSFLKDSATATLFIPDYYFNGKIVDKLANKWKEYTPAAEGEKVVCLTFDDGPATANTNKILDVLEQYQAKATFFMAGHRLNTHTYPVLKRVLEAGSQIGNHSFSHVNFNTLSLEGIMNEINRTQELVYEATGTYPTCVRPPYGNLKKELVAQTGMYSIHWNVDTLDWQHRNTQTLVDYVLSNTHSGDIILMHDIHASTAAGVEAIVKGLQEQGFRLVTVEEMFDLRNSEPSGLKYFSQNVIR